MLISGGLFTSCAEGAKLPSTRARIPLARGKPSMFVRRMEMHNPLPRLTFAAACAVILSAGAAPLAQRAEPTVKTDRLTLDTFLEMETVSDPQLSPDGSQIIYTRGWVDKMNDRRESALWIMNADGSKNRFLSKGSNARWSPTGDRIAYTAPGEPRGSQVFVRWMDAEGATSQITRLEQAPGGIAWSPDGTQLSFTSLVEERTNWPIKMPKAPSGAKWTEAPRIVERLQYRRDRTGLDRKSVV